MILVTGATGTIGSHVVRLLADRGAPARAMTRDPVRVPALDGIEPVPADYDDPASLGPAVAGVDTVFLLTARAAADHDVALLDAARAAGVRRVVKLSAIGAGEVDDDGAVLGAWHAEAEVAVRASGLAWTVLRPTTFASNLLWWAPLIRAGAPVPNTMGDGKQGIVDPRDVAAVAVEILADTRPGSVHDGRTYTLTGPDLLTVPEQLVVLGEVLGRPIDAVDQAPDAARRDMLAAGTDEAVVDAMLVGAAWVRAGRNAVLTDDVARLLARPPTTFESWANAHQEAFNE